MYVSAGADWLGKSLPARSPVGVAIERRSLKFVLVRIELPSPREMLVLAALAWMTALVFVSAAVRIGGAFRPVAIVLVIGATLWTFMTGLRWVGRKSDD